MLARALTLCLLAASAAAQTCTTCRGAGELPCPNCAATEATCRACTVAAACARCRGALAIACPDCKTPPASLAQRDGAAQQFLADCRARLATNGLDRGSVPACRTGHVELWFAPGRLDGAPDSDPHVQMHRFAALLEQQRERLLALTGLADCPPLRVAVLQDERAARRLGRAFAGVETQGLGATGGEPAALVLQVAPGTDDPALRRALAFHVALLHLAPLDLDARGHGWLLVGTAHVLEAEAGGGRCENFVLQGRPQPPQRFHGGDWRTGCRELLEQGRLPALADLCGREVDELDFAQQAAAFACVEFLQQLPAAVVTGDAARPMPPFQRLFAGGLRDAPPAALLPKLLGKDLAAIEPEFRAFVVRKYARR